MGRTVWGLLGLSIGWEGQLLGGKCASCSVNFLIWRVGRVSAKNGRIKVHPIMASPSLCDFAERVNEKYTMGGRGVNGKLDEEEGWAERHRYL